MDLGSIEKITKHVTDVRRFEIYLESLSAEEIEDLVKEKQTEISERWAQCRRGFRQLFTAVNQGKRFPIDSFDIKIADKKLNNEIIDIFVRIWRDPRNHTFTVKPFVRDGIIESQEFETEQFGNVYNYRYGTYPYKAAKLAFSKDTPDPLIQIERLEGHLVNEHDLHTEAVFLAAIDNLVAPSVKNTEETLWLVIEAAQNENLNPEIAQKFRPAR